MNIYKKLIELQKTLGYLTKDESVMGKYKYASGEAILKIARPKMDELGLLLFQEIVHSEIEHVEYRTQSGTKQQTFCHCTFKFTWINADEPTEQVINLFEASGLNDWDKSIGSAMTYAERYYFMKTFHVPTDDLEPNKRQDEPVGYKPQYQNEVSQSPIQNISENSITIKQIGLIKVKMKKVFNSNLQAGVDYINAKYNTEHVSGLTKKQASEFIDYLNSIENDEESPI